MKINAKFSSRCPACGGLINPGDEVEWEKGKKATHVTCPEKPEASPVPEAKAEGKPTQAWAQVRGGAQRAAGRNKRRGHCDRCGQMLEIGQGSLVRCYADTGCMQHFDEDGWHVYCLDTEACKVRQEENRAERKAAQEKAKKAAEEKRAREAEQAAAYKAEYERAQEGRISWYHDIGAKDLTLVAEDKSGLYQRRLYRGEVQGETVYVEHADAYDDNRVTIWAPATILQPIIDEKAAKITKAEAREWLEKYSGCLGAELYRRALEIGLDESEEVKL